MRIPSGKTDQAIYFVAVDPTDLKTRKTGLTGFTVYRSRNGGTPVAYTTPTITELSSTNMPGVYSLLVDEDTTIASTSDSEEYCVHITHASMAPVTRTIELYRREVTSGQTLSVSGGVGSANVTQVDGAALSAHSSGKFPSDVRDFGGTAGTFSGGRPEVNTSHVSGTLQTARDLGAQLDVAVSTRLAPTVAGRTLDVSVGGEAGIDWSNIGSPTTAQNLSGTTISTSQVVASVTGSVGSVTGNVGGNLLGSIGSLSTQAKADVNAEVDAALDTAIPATPTADSINERIKTLDDNYTATRAAKLDNLDAAVSSRLAPAVAGRTLEVSATGKAGIDLDNTSGSLAKGTEITGFNDLDAAGVRSAVGLSAANLDAQLASIQSDLPIRITRGVALAAFPFVMFDSSDHVTGKTGLTVSAERSIDGAAFAPCANPVVEIGGGWYRIDLAASDLNGNTIALRFTAAGADPQNITIVTEPT